MVVFLNVATFAKHWMGFDPILLERAVSVAGSIANYGAGQGWAVGMYALSLRVTRPGLPAWTTNAVPIALAPLASVSPLNATPGDVQLTLTCTPRLQPEQEAHASLIFGSRQVMPDSVVTPADPTQPSTLVFTVPGVEAGEYLVRLRVSGVDSLPIVTTGTPPTLAFDPQQKVTVA